ncbi:MAG TPA: FAD-dependent oxidoreductase [Candidatus Sulfopaludibacter sp.]|nr:FAD-dependent oxidoreductase [Candidatus Sulfopaludibacter sp.]
MALVVIGGVAAGLSAAARARRLDARLEIVVLEKGPVVSYGACGLPYLVEGRVREAKQLIVYTPEYLRKERNIEVRTGARVVAISHPRREVALESGERIKYDKLVVATGARCDTSGIAGANQAHVFTLHTLDDAERMRRFIRERRPKRAVVIGAGYIGVEAADALRRNGLRVTVVEGSRHALLRDDAALTAAVAKQLEEHGVELRTGVTVKSVDDVPADMVVIAAGFKPNVELAAEAGVETGRLGAIRTDDRMETNVRGIFAAGDCAEVTHLVTGRSTYIPLGTTANKCGRVAGANAAGGRERFPGIVGTSIVGIFDLAFATTGFSVEHARAEGFTPVAARIEAQSRPKYFRGRKTVVELVADRGTRRLVGGTVIGEEGAAGRINVIAAALGARMRVDDFEQLDLAYSPPFASTWDPLLIAAQQLMKEM